MPRGASVTSDKPMMTDHCYPKSIVYFGVHTRYSTFYEFWQMYHDRTHCHSIKQASMPLTTSTSELLDFNHFQQMLDGLSQTVLWFLVAVVPFLLLLYLLTVPYGSVFLHSQTSPPLLSLPHPLLKFCNNSEVTWFKSTRNKVLTASKVYRNKLACPKNFYVET